jgi:uncharacterized pyridoxal phosphate-containing UPF0001 family protein
LSFISSALQSNKVRDALQLFDVIHTLDRPKIAAALDEETKRAGKHPRLLVQVNTGEEAQKAGVLPSETDAFVARCRDEYGLVIEGLMCIPPLDEEPAMHFALLAKIAGRLGLEGDEHGMSGDREGHASAPPMCASARHLGARHALIRRGRLDPAIHR